MRTPGKAPPRSRRGGGARLPPRSKIGLWVVGEGHSSNRNTDNLQECPSKAPAPSRYLLLPYHTLQRSLGGWCRQAAGGVVPPGGAGDTIFAICMNGVRRSIGTGKMVVELFSAATSRSVWR